MESRAGFFSWLRKMDVWHSPLVLGPWGPLGTLESSRESSNKQHNGSLGKVKKQYDIWPTVTRNNTQPHLILSVLLITKQLQKSSMYCINWVATATLLHCHTGQLVFVVKERVSLLISLRYGLIFFLLQNATKSCVKNSIRESTDVCGKQSNRSTAETNEDATKCFDSPK